MDRYVFPLDPHHVGVPSVTRKMIFEALVHSAQTATYLASRLTLSPNGLNGLPLDPRHLGVQSDASKILFYPMVRSAL
jgi:hypothetical protein